MTAAADVKLLVRPTVCAVPVHTSRTTTKASRLRPLTSFASPSNHEELHRTMGTPLRMAHALIQGLAFLLTKSAQQNHSQYGLGRDIGSHRTLTFHLSCPGFIIFVAKQRSSWAQVSFVTRRWLSLSPIHKELLEGSRIIRSIIQPLSSRTTLPQDQAQT